MKNYKKNLLVLFLFIIFLFMKNNVFGASTITYNNWEGAPQYSSIPPLNLPTGVNSYITMINNECNEVVVLLPYHTNDYVALMGTDFSNNSYYSFCGYNNSSNTRTDLNIYTSNFSTNSNSWSDWSYSTVQQTSAYTPYSGNYIVKSKFNVVCYINGIGSITKEIVSNGFDLPDGIKLTDNIVFTNRNGFITLAYTDHPNNYFKISGNYLYCCSATGSNVSFTAYSYDNNKKIFNPQGTKSNYYIKNSSDTVSMLYCSNNFDYSNQMLSWGAGNFFDFYYASEYIYPYIADTDEVLQHIDEYEYILILPGSLIKNNLPFKFFIAEIVDDIQGKSVFEISLDTLSPYYRTASNNSNEYWFEVPVSLFKDNLITDTDYLFSLIGSSDYDDFNITRRINYQGATFIPPTNEDIQTDAINNQTQKIEEQTNAIINQTEKIEEQTEVSKNIFQKIGDILSYINPLSENFFAYKLIDLLIEALKSLFVPEERFFRFLF